jgi:hypothetical protein
MAKINQTKKQSSSSCLRPELFRRKNTFYFNKGVILLAPCTSQASLHVFGTFHRRPLFYERRQSLTLLYAGSIVQNLTLFRGHDSDYNSVL